MKKTNAKCPLSLNMLKPEGFYIWVDNLDLAIDFYQKIFQKKIVNREKNRWQISVMTNRLELDYIII
jgi:predicted enzyme related to lactoylglutathione lyase